MATSCTALVAAAVMPLMVGSAQATRERVAILDAQQLAEAALGRVLADARAAGSGLEGATSIQIDGFAFPVIGSTDDGGLRLVRSLGPPREIDPVVVEPGAGGGVSVFWIADARGLRAGANVVGIGLPGRPRAEPVPVGIVAAVYSGESNGSGAGVPEMAEIIVDWPAPEEALITAWGPPRALAEIVIREYRTVPYGQGLQLRRRDAGGIWQPIAEDVSLFSVSYELDRAVASDSPPPVPPTGRSVADLRSVVIEIRLSRPGLTVVARGRAAVRGEPRTIVP